MFSLNVSKISLKGKKMGKILNTVINGFFILFLALNSSGAIFKIEKKENLSFAQLNRNWSAYSITKASRRVQVL